MKTIVCALFPLLAAAGLLAAPLQKQHVSADAKWLIHVDVEKLLTTQLGEFLGREFLDKQLAKPARDLKKQFGIDFEWRRIQSLTAYGTDFAKRADGHGVLIIQSRLEVPASLDTIIDQMAAQLGEGRTPLLRVQDEPFPIYAANNEIFGTPAGGLFLLSKSKEQLLKARQVVVGKAASLATSQSFPALSEGGRGFLVAAVGEGFSDNAKLPPPAKGLKNAEGGQVVAGEDSDRVFVDVALKARTAESATQMQQVMQGLLAMAALNQTENEDLQKLVQGAKVSGSDKTVNVKIELPASDVIDKVSKARKRRR